MELDLMIRDIPIYVICKFEIFTFKGARVIKHYVWFAFLFVQTVCCFILDNNRLFNSVL